MSLMKIFYLDLFGSLFRSPPPETTPRVVPFLLLLKMGGGAMDADFGRSPGPVYSPKNTCFGRGPSGKGSEFSLATRSFSVSIDDKKTRDSDFPGPQYAIPSGLSKQVESHKWSQNAGKFNASERKTFDVGQERSPGPAAYDTRPPPVREERSASGKPSAKLMGSAMRFFPSPPEDKGMPGPGTYKLKGSVGGAHPAMQAAPVVGFSKATLRDQKLVERSPGPIYAAAESVGTQYSSAKRSAGKFGFGSSSRFPVTGTELVDHMNAIHRVKGGIMPTPPRRRRLISHGPGPDSPD